jgi:hypothetical protein
LWTNHRLYRKERQATQSNAMTAAFIRGLTGFCSRPIIKKEAKMTNHQEIEIEEGVVIHIRVSCDLQVHGSEGSAVRADGSDVTPSLRQTDGRLRVECDGDCVVYVPVRAHVEIETHGDLLVDGLLGEMEIIFCGGDVRIAGAGAVQVKEAGGDVSIAGGGAVQVKKVGGDLSADHIASIDAREVYGDAHLSDVAGPVSVNASGDAHIHQVAGPVSVNTKGDTHLLRCRGEIAVNAAGNVNLQELVSQRVRAVSKGDIRVHLVETVGGQAKIVTGGDLHVRNGEKVLRKGRGVYTFRFGQGDAALALVSKGDTLLEGVEVAEGNLRGVNEEMGNLGAELGAELGAMGAEMGREFGNLGRDIARQVQDKLQRKLQAKMKDIGKRTAKAEWGEGKSWSFNLGDAPTPPKPPTPPVPPVPPGWDAPFAAVEELATGEPVSEEERSLVLRMLEEGKISATEAATLLEALGDAE